jgi:hypothetical protein
VWRQGVTRPSNTFPPQILRCPSTLQGTHSVRCETTCPARRAQHGILQTPASTLELPVERICCTGRMVVRHTALVGDGASLPACVACIDLGGESKPLAPKQRRLLGSACTVAALGAWPCRQSQRQQKVYRHAPGCVHHRGRAGSAAAGGGASASGPSEQIA